MEKISLFKPILILIILSEYLLSASNPHKNFNESNPSETTNEELVLQYLKNIQDNFSYDAFLVPAMEDNSGQTFNNAVTAMAFILTDEKERAERILDFYANRMDSSNQILNSQNFFYYDEARGFFQNVDLDNLYYPFICDRWMGDNAWLLIAFKYYELEYGFDTKPNYTSSVTNLKNLLLDFYIDDPFGHGGFVRHGWRWGPRNSSQPQNDYQLHESDSSGNPIGHEEGNIDAYAALKLCGEYEKAEMIKDWIDYRMTELQGNPNLPLDLFSWRSLAFCNEGLYYKLLVNVPENDPGFKKQITFLGREAIGFFSRDDASIQNVWLDGLGHMVCAFYSSGNIDKGNFYSAQLDSFLINPSFGSSNSLAVPYTANKTGGYDWVDIGKGFSSSCAWYIFAKNGFNPFTFEMNLPTSVKEAESTNINLKFNQNFPNPFNLSTTISYLVPKNQPVEIIIFDILGKKVKSLFEGYSESGVNEIVWDGKNERNEIVNSGMYFYRIKSNEIILSGKMVLNK
ncbi:MAG TPA: T9SS type A sorting domain-containing protein [Ignavibacteriaceae bacterium]|nr:T9SS type A sorting domain-containing protein [Ignavibacteriaceae bacterium]